MFGKLSLSAIPYENPIIMGAVGGAILLALVILALITYYRKWTYLWKEWLTSLDHKRIGIMYIILALVMLLRGFSDAIMMRSQQALAAGASQGYLPPDHFNQIFSAHGTIMIIFMAMPFLVGLMNIVVPQQIGARDVAFPFLNSVSLWLTAAGALLVMVSLGVGEFSKAGWSGYAPLTELQYSPGTGVDYWIWAFQIAGIGSLMTGINFLVTILKMRAPGMTLMRMPMFVWTALFTTVLMMFCVSGSDRRPCPADARSLSGHAFFHQHPGRQHDDVCQPVLDLGASRGLYRDPAGLRRLLGGRCHLLRQTAVRLYIHGLCHRGDHGPVLFRLGAPFLHHGRRSRRQHLFRHYDHDDRRPHRGEDLQLAFHHVPRPRTIHHADVLDPGIHHDLCHRRHDRRAAGRAARRLRAPQQPVSDRPLPQHADPRRAVRLFRGLFLLVPEGHRLSPERKMGQTRILVLADRFLPAFMPLYVLGFMGMPRRMEHYANLAWQPYLIIAAGGTAVILLGILFQMIQLVVSIRERHATRDLTGDPWDGRTLEWATSSPPAVYNFAKTPVVHDIDAFMDMKEKGIAYQQPDRYHDIHMPKNTADGFIIGVLAFVFGFAMVWYIWWLAVLSALGMLFTVIARASDDDTEYIMPAAEVERIENQRYRQLASAATNRPAGGHGHAGTFTGGVNDDNRRFDHRLPFIPENSNTRIPSRTRHSVSGFTS